MSNHQSFPVSNFSEFRNKMLAWANRFNIFCLLDNHQYNFEKPGFECLLAVGCKKRIETLPNKAFSTLKSFSNNNPGWLFGHFGYDLKNETEKLSSDHFDGIGFSSLCFFVPEMVLQLSAKEVSIYTEGNAEEIFSTIDTTFAESVWPGNDKLKIKSRFSKEQYIAAVNKIKEHIHRGDCYELNFCQEFYSDAATINPLQIYIKLAALSPSPFASMYKLDDKYCLCASPERFLKKTGNRLISQPIKGTSKRDLHNEAEDRLQKEYLLASKKEKSENVMIVDLVRNDLSRICKEGSVKVEELFGVYSFPQVHQMISTIIGEAEDNLHWVDAIKATFPMGSMTGAPKKKVMELIEKYERTKRGLFSGAIGYSRPDGDFDFNVVIRSVLYNESSRYLSFQAGSGITFYSDAEKEFEECLMKAAAIRMVLE